MEIVPLLMGVALGGGLLLVVMGFRTLTNKALDDDARKRGFWRAFIRTQFSTINMSISVPMKHRKASSGEHTMGSLRTLKLVFTNTGQPVRS